MSKKSTKPSGSLRDRLLKNSTIKHTSILEDSKLFNTGMEVQTPVPMINCALGGTVTSGLQGGVLVIAGPSKHFKTGFTLLMARSFIREHGDDAMILFYDSEFGSPKSYFASFDIPTDQVVHTPITDIEVLKFDIMQQLENLEREDKVLIMIDSIGNLASKKEVEDAINMKSVADMSRAKQLKSFFRIITPHVNLKDIPVVAINHIYMEQGMFPKAIVSGGSGPYLSADDIWILGRRQEKDGKDVVGYSFVINIEKSRSVKEKSKIPITITHEGGIAKWSGLFELALEFGLITSPKQGFYAAVDPSTGEIGEKLHRKSAFEHNGDFWKKMLTETDFAKKLTAKFKLSEEKLLDQETNTEEGVGFDVEVELNDGQEMDQTILADSTDSVSVEQGSA